ncbi:MAG: enoyl-CoA hydratase/isomerase family protein [Burkholderiales bacterium]|nr:enoyl-CoA hydratase/isomerase family protein [Burkholderiales bacterium]
MAENIRVSRDGVILTISIARADAGNRLTNEMAGALADALDAAGDSRVILLRALGPDFCLGRDIEPPAPGAGVRALDVLRDDAGPIIALYAALARRNQPIVGLVQGKAWGIGLVLAAMCDLSFAAQGSSFRLRELERGIPPCIAMAPLLHRLPGKALAHLVYTAGEMDAAWALANGVVSEIADGAALERRAREAAERIVSFPPEAVDAVKQFMAHAPRSDESKAVLYGASLLANVLGSR